MNQGRSATKDMIGGEITIDSKIRALAFIPGQRLRVVSGEESSVQVRHLGNSLVGEQIESSTGALAVAATRDGQRIVAGSTDGFTIWNTSGDVPVKVVHHSIGGVRTIDISFDSKWVITGSDSRTADVWDISTGERHPTLGPFRHEYNVIAVKFCPCGRRVATATLFGSIRIFSITLGQKIVTLPVSVIVSPTLAYPNVTLAWLAHSKRPQLLAVSQGHIKCLDADDGSVIIQWPLRGVTHPSSVILSSNNRLIAYTLNTSVIIRDVTTGQQIGDALKHDNNVLCISLSPDNNHLIVGADTKLTLYDLRKILIDTSYFRDTTTECAASCAHHIQDTVKKIPPTVWDRVPLLSIVNAAVKPWLHSYLEIAEEVLSKEIEKSTSVADHNMYANRALIWGRLGNGKMALEDAEKSLSLKRSPIGQIAKTIAIICQGNHALAMQEIPKVLQSDHSVEYILLLRVIQSILSCLSGKYEEEISHVMTLSKEKKYFGLLFLVQGNMHLYKEKFEDAMQSVKKAQVPNIFPHDITPEMWSISYIFGWKFSGLGIQVQQRRCEFLLKGGNSEAADVFLELKNTYQREIATHAEFSSWASTFGRDCLKKLETLGDEALIAKNYHEAIQQYKAVEPLIAAPKLKYALLLKRSEVLAEEGSKENLDQALKDADEAIKIDSSIPWGFERKHAALDKFQDYVQEAAEALDQVISLVGSSKDPKSAELRSHGVNPEERKKIILEVVKGSLDRDKLPRPRVLIDTKSGRLCDKQKQIEAFRGDIKYKELVLSPTLCLSGDDPSLKEVIRDYFRYSTLSHTWEDSGEPKFLTVEKISIDTLEPSLPHKKLQMFCSKAREHGYRWAWSDTCCIDKGDTEVWNESLRSMYRWYSESSLTIVHLKGVYLELPVADVDTIMQFLEELLNEFVGCRWNQRAWTLQEYFASKVIHFYTNDWKPYLPIQGRQSGTNVTNHKYHFAIQRGMERVTNLRADCLAALKPGTDDARQKLRLASTRSATMKEDIAYSLLGIFGITIETTYSADEVPRALGRLLGALLTKSADVTILAWTGKPSEYNTCLPVDVTVYTEPESLYVPPLIAETELPASDLIPDMCSSSIPRCLEPAVELYNDLLNKPPPELLHGRLKLACIRFQLDSITKDPGTHNFYIASGPLLREKIELKPAEDLSRYPSGDMFLVHPWFRCLQDPGNSPLDNTQHKSALRFLLALKQPFGALLLAWNNAARDYKRIATEQLIKAQIREEVSSEQLLKSAVVLYIR